MRNATKIVARRKSAKTFLRGLAAATCLTAASAGVAHATTTNEGATDFGNDFASRTQLSVGTDVVNGVLTIPSIPADQDFFEFSGLAANGSFDILFSTTNITSNPNGLAFTDSHTTLGTPSSVQFAIGSPQHITGTIPSDGKIVVQITPFEGTAGPYTVSLTAPLAASVPEPASGLLGGLGAAALAVRNLKRKLNK